MREANSTTLTIAAADRTRLLLDAVCSSIGPDTIVAIGDGGFCEHIIEGFRPLKTRIEGIVPCSQALARRLKSAHFPVYDFSEVDWIDLFVGAAEEVTKQGHMLLSRSDTIATQKVIAAGARNIVCLADDTQLVGYFDKASLAVEVIPMARSYVARRLAAMGGLPELRENHHSDNGNVIIDVRNLDLVEPAKIESQINLIPGVVDCGLFAQKYANTVLVAARGGLQVINT